ncbi:MAG: Hsp20/alpha crystallin family protein [Patescibacteria group bacterium]
MIFRKKGEDNHLITKTSPSITEWLDYEEPESEGQLAIDVYQTDKKIIIQSTIAGAKPEDLKISLHNDLLTIRGTRLSGGEINNNDYLYRECYWGAFSRSIILPAEVDSKHVEAELENGVLTITLYKHQPDKIEIKIKD